MASKLNLGLAVLVLLAGGATYLGVTVYPLAYGPLNGLVSAGIVIAAGFVQFVLGDSTV
ncbi:hypothetical protein VB773_01280 [Haloarculaceae archaeon H-GB2-1]|nr:hypothetical protein [Haloarculaceae archaeon H-GB1-1]MEA5406347.1 hypothetical protein [Haloarculaceae archaeon H-GB2-1]